MHTIYISLKKEKKTANGTSWLIGMVHMYSYNFSSATYFYFYFYFYFLNYFSLYLFARSDFASIAVSNS